MTGIPKYPAVQLNDAIRDLITASQAVKQGIATHAEKHAAAQHEAHAKMEQDKQLEVKTGTA